MSSKLTFVDIPYDILAHILKFTNLITISKLQCLNLHFYNLINPNKWHLIDNTPFDISFVPSTIETCNNYIYCIDFFEILQNKKHIPEQLIERINNHKTLELICLYQQLSETLLCNIYSKIHYRILLAHQILPTNILFRLTQNELLSFTNNDWYLVWSKQKINMQYIQNYIDNVQWNPLSSNKYAVSFEFIEKYHTNIIWHQFTKHGINEHLIEKYIYEFDFICWSNISQYTKLSNKFIVKHINDLHIDIILRFQSLEEYLLTILLSSNNQSSINHYSELISLNQKVSINFIKTHTLPLKHLVRNKKIPRKILASIFSNTSTSHINFTIQ